MEANVLLLPPGVNFQIVAASFSTNRLPDPSKAKLQGPDSPEANVLLTPAGAILTIVPA